ncbi:serine protease [Streptomyces tauricus]|uniref:Alpha-lytic protease prodomain-containing protein n=1 Tax=Streptomyces tauricus TaxID=68274 RepID=A0ABZ1JD37_9ACTN|nr:alpha-lytic protease prodomain-containing protein [Streptomyces tauricus]MCW8098070.1 alpha-lytic protease prodomain-containing protein [Streptomyces tauricus]GHA10634.1 serine protease [Streptomyces tauricus]
MVPRHARGAARTALTVLGALALTGLPAAVAAEPPAPGPSSAQTLGADRPSAAVLRAMQRDLRLTGAQAKARLVNEAEAGTRAGRLQNALGKHFAGAWVHGTTSAGLTVATTDAAGVAAIKADGAQAKVVKNALKDLNAAKSKLDAAATGKALDTPVRYVDVRTNLVTVQATSRAAADKLIAAAGIDRRLVGVKVSADRPRALHDVRGGDAYYIDEKARCSVGFSVTKGEQQGFASAGHCGKAGAKTTGFNKVAQGTFEASVFPGQDMSWVSVNSEWTATPAVKGEGETNVQVAGSVQALVGAAICRSGSTTGWHCGTIEQHDTTVSYAEGDISGVTRTTVCAEPGDSGGSYVSGTQAQGVTSGGSGDCKAGGVTFYQPVNPLLTTYGLTLKTAPAQSGTPAPEDGQTVGWTTGRVYEVGTRVTYDGVAYQCLQTHQAQGVWQPRLTPALWQRL